MRLWGNDYGGTLLVFLLVKLPYNWVLVRIHCEHGEADHQFT